MNTHTQTIFRDAAIEDCPTVAQLMRIASDGVCDYIWSLQQKEFPSLTPIEIGAKRYAEDEGNFSYRNCTIALSSDRSENLPIQGMVMAFAVPPETAVESPQDLPEEIGLEILAPYMMEHPNSWYICALAVFPQYRGQGIGTQLLDLAIKQAKERRLPTLSLLCFEQNTGALRLYQRYGFEIIDHAKVVPHPLIHHTGDILLMTKSV
ncbi:GNAT family N-acetyltransferase [Oscillatoria sp. CS-180]|uniref:GNAT family N-acetyltransferase n=1 Tax=Oscillatoria sp. CS-180 TaxID=3021720 RepID=UPI00232AE076|nr:GNAT family N-acetyltransferase [Oscillatoria sp. CS-180]MDB9524952.1 GNAT family N-acetyltransferase [Oscillatoria sp. CS-180]